MRDIVIQTLESLSQNNKYARWYIELILKCDSIPPDEGAYCENHHILPKCFKASVSGEILSSKENLIRLPTRYHFVAHLLLTKMFLNKVMNSKMNFAFHQMKLKNRHQGDRYGNSRLYALVKKEKRKYIRFYSTDKVFFVDETDLARCEQMINLGCTTIMPEAYKKGRVGNMIGKNHSVETILKMQISGKKTPRTWLIKKPVSEITKIRRNETMRRKEQEDPDVYKASREAGELKRKELRASGKISFKGKNNPRYGKSMSEEWKEQHSELLERKRNNGLTHIEMVRDIILPALSKNCLTMEQIRKLISCKWRTGYLKKLIIEADPNFDLSKIIKSKITRSPEYVKCHSEYLQRKNNNGYTHREIYDKYIQHNAFSSISLADIRSALRLSNKVFKNILVKFHPRAMQIWEDFKKSYEFDRRT